MAAPTANQNQESPSQRARLERLRQPAIAIPAPGLLADQIDEVCDDLNRMQLTAVTARDDEEMAWLVLCDRGWPRDVSVEGLDVTPAYAWIAAWGEFTSLPVEIATAQDRTKQRWIEERLEACEAPLPHLLPDGLWLVVGPLDATGRATLAYVLRALAALLDARSHCAAAATRREELFGRFTLFRNQARQLGVRAPLAPLDARAWRAAATALRSIRE